LNNYVKLIILSKAWSVRIVSDAFSASVTTIVVEPAAATVLTGLWLLHLNGSIGSLLHSQTR